MACFNMLPAFGRALRIRARGRKSASDRDSTLESDPGLVTIDPKWINLDEIRHWIDVCATGHGKRCETATMTSLQTVLNQRHIKRGQDETPQRPAWLVDVKDECIVPAVEHRYISLSYVWGDVRGTEATREVMEILQRPGSLGKHSKKIIVPRTIRHAMELIGLLGERYLWVDRFCICQDDADSKHSQLNLMGQIFGGAYFTIIAANGWDADHGLRGIKGVTEPRNLTSQLLTQSEYQRCIDCTSTVWYSRGWTFQEMLLSPRRLIFLYQYVIWECSRGVWHESTGTTGSFPAFPDSNRTQFSTPGGPPGLEVGTRSLMFDALTLNPARHYLEVVRQYNTRALTFPEDGLNAFLGIMTQLAKQFPDGFLWALPIAWFDVALLWQPYEDMTRRRPKRADALQLPSWSWVGWQGLIDHRCWEEKYEVDIKPTTPHVEAPSTLQRSATQPTRITPICKFLYTDNGVTKIVKPRDTESGSDHRAAPVQQPSPILLVHGPVARWKMRGGQSSSIGFRKAINMCFKWIYEPDLEDESLESPCGIMIMSPTLFSMTSEVECEMLALSSAISPLKDEPVWATILKGHPQAAYLKENDCYEYYNVLWITRKDGIAYRRGLGKIAINVGDYFSLQWDHFQLG